MKDLFSFRISSTAPANLGALILSPGGHQYQNYAATAARAPGARRRDSRNANGEPTRLVMAGTNLPAPAVIVGSINNSEADGGDGPDRGDLGDPLRGAGRAHNAPAVARSRGAGLSTRDRMIYYSAIRADAMRQAESDRREFIERRRQETLEEGREWNSEDEGTQGSWGIPDDYLAVPEHLARRDIAGYADHMRNIYQVSLFPFQSGAEDDRVHSFVTV